MRRFLSVIGGAALILTVATPAEASWTYFPFAVSPVAGPTGTTINVRGDCQESQPGVATLRIAGTEQNLDARFFGPGPFNVDLTNRAGVDPNGFPVELDVHVDCFGLSGRPQPFSSTARAATSQPPQIVTTPGSGPCGIEPTCRAHLKGFDKTGALAKFNRYISDWRSGATVALGDVDADGSDDVVVARGPEPGRWAELAVLTRTVESGGGRFPMDPFDGGLSVAIGDVVGDRANEIIVAAGPGGGPHVYVFGWTGPYRDVNFFAYDPSYRGGVHVATADVDGDGKEEIITGTGAGGGPHVRVFKGNGTPVGPGFFAYDPAFRGGVHVAGVTPRGARAADIVTAPGPGGGPHVRSFSASGVARGAGFYAYDPAFLGGVSVAGGDVSGFGDERIVTAPYRGGAPHVRVFDPNGVADGVGFYAYGNTPAGVRLAVAP